MKQTSRTCTAVITTFFITVAMATPPTIGTASARGDLRINGSAVSSNATLFDGSVVETSDVAASLRLEKGPSIQLATDSRGKVFHDRLVLERGSTEFVNLGQSFKVAASAVNISSGDASARGVVSISSGQTVEVAALTGGFDVKTSSGMLLGRVVPGRSLAFKYDGTGASGATTLSGTLSKNGASYFLTVKETGVIYQVEGKNLDHYVGKRVSVTGTLDPAATALLPASAVVILSHVALIAGATAAGTATAVGVAVGAKLAIAGVVIAAATAAGVGVYKAQASTPTASVP